MEKLIISTVVATLFCSALAAQTSTEQIKFIPVILYPDTDHGTCSIGLQVNAGGAVLRSGPGIESRAIATLIARHVVSGCDEQNGWKGIIDGQDEACSVGILVDTERFYSGPCSSGWIDQSFLTLIYG
ncbi:MAG: hypothetical protein HRU33_11550 [Rhodobacteraceae bacterium]|nr:hypothetical protein [Paracoccaceae bacterium]